MRNEHITVEELFGRVRRILSSDTKQALSEMRETLTLVCGMGLRDTRHDFGSLSSKVDYLCRKHGLTPTETVAIQRMRRHCNSTEPVSQEDIGYDCQTLCHLIGTVAQCPIPKDIAVRLPKDPIRRTRRAAPLYDCIRCTLQDWDNGFMIVLPDDDNASEPLRICYCPNPQEDRYAYTRQLFWQGMQLNLINCRHADCGIVPDFLIVEPDYTIDISALAACFEQFGHHPLLYTLNRLKERPNTKYTLLGNYAGRALDEIINNPEATTASILRANFNDMALEYATCGGFDASEFKREAARQTDNIRQIVSEMFSSGGYSTAVLEPTFVCERLGISGRADLLTTDMRLLVEQKSGKNIFIERGFNNVFGGRHVEKHYVQLLLYHAILCQNFSLKAKYTDIRLLYSRYALPEGLIEVETLKKLLAEALQLRNDIVATEYGIARNGFASVLPHLNAETVNTKNCHDLFCTRYLLPQINAVTAPLQSLQPTERAYLCRMMTFVIKEQIRSKTGGQAGTSGSAADLWNMTAAEKLETGNILMGLTLLEKSETVSGGGYDMLTFGIEQADEGFLPNFRLGDMIYLYSYRDNEQPDARRNVLFKGVIAELTGSRVAVHLNNRQHNSEVFAADRDGSRHRLFAIEHAGSDIGGTAAMRSLYVLMTATPSRRSLLLSQRPPQADTSLRLSRHYGADIDDMLLRAKQARDFFLLIGPPGTGKTSIALRHITEEHLDSDKSHRLLLTAYTNRAVDEICSMLRTAGIDFLRIGGRYSCDPAFRDSLVESMAGKHSRLDDIRARMMEKRVVVGTTSSLMSRPFIFSLMRFSLAVVDEAGQLTEPSVMGLLAAHSESGGKHDCIGKFILVGDYKQLPAVVQQSEEESAVEEPLLRAIGLNNCRESLFERLVRQERSAGRTAFIGILRKQGRMHPDVAEFPNRMFYRDERLIPVPCQHQIDTEIGYSQTSDDRIDEALKAHRMLFIPSPPCRDEAASEKVNTQEARIVAELLRHIRRLLGSKFDAERSVGVIVPYRNQIAMIRHEAEKLSLPELRRVSIDTVERYQGSQRDIIIYSFTVHRQYQLDFLTACRTIDNGLLIDRKLNVALTRARKQMLITGNPLVVGKDPLFRQLMDFVKDRGGYFAMPDQPAP